MTGKESGIPAWDRTPLRARLVGILVVLLVAALAASGWGSQQVLKGYLVDQVDEQLKPQLAERIIDTAQQRPDSWRDEAGEWPSPYVILLAVDGREPELLPLNPDVRSDSGLLPRFPEVSSAQVSEQPGRAYVVRSEDGSMRWRLVAYPLLDGGRDRIGYAVVGLPLNQVDAAVRRLRLLLLVFGTVLTVACALLGWFAIRRAFRPLLEVERTAAAIAAGDLSRRVPDHPAGTEVGRLTSALNGMLAQIERAFRAREQSEARTRRFAADASHELRTPLAAIRGYAELYRQGAVREPEDVGRTMGRIEDEARRMGTLVEDLLLLARLDERRPARTDPVDLAVLAGDAVHDARGLAPDRTVRLVGLGDGGPQPAVATGDEGRLRQVVANLLANAVRHTPAGSPVEVAVGREDGNAVLEIRDHGPGIPPEHAARVFERFYRVDSSRTRRQGGGSGLGLSIVAAVVAAHGGRVGIAPTAGGGATFRVELPAAEPRAPEPEVGPEAPADVRSEDARTDGRQE